MIYINHNAAIKQMTNLIDHSFNQTQDFIPKAFLAEQKNALALLKKRVLLEEIIEESIYFNQNLNWEKTNENLHLVNTVEDLIEVFKLRSDIYTDIGYQHEFPDTIEGLNFDKYDKNAAILFYKSESKVTGTTRLIFDSHNKLPTEKKVSFENIRENYETIGELSRLIIGNNKKGLNVEFKYLMQGIHTLFMHNKIDITILAIIKEHYKLYTKFGGSEIIQEMDDYGDLGHEMYLLSWNPSMVSSFFKKVFL